MGALWGGSRPAAPDDRAAARRRLALLETELGATAARLDEESDRAAPTGAEDPSTGRHRAAAEAQLRASGLRGTRRRVTGQHVAVVAVLVAVLLSFGAWWVLSGRPEQQVVGPVMAGSGQPEAPASPPLAPETGAAPEAGTDPTAASTPVPTAGSSLPTDGPAPPAAAPPAAAPSAAAPVAGAPVAAAPVAGAATVVVDVVGRVRQPGLVVLPAGSRVADALRSAGGMRPGVNRVALNLARPLVDGEQILVGVRALTVPAPPATVPAPTTGVAPTSGAVPTLVDLNTATLEQLDTLPGIGPVTGQAILDWRAANGAFTSVDELLEVDGIGDATLADLRDLVTV